MKPWVRETDAMYKIAVITEYIAVFLKRLRMLVQDIQILLWYFTNEAESFHEIGEK